MISSMTGFGHAGREVDGIAYTVEIKTVNNRYLKTIVKLSDYGSFLADDIEKLLRKHIHRGTVNYSLSIQNVCGQALYNVDENALNQYISKLRDVAKANDIHGEIGLAELLTLPGVIQPGEPDAEYADRMREAVLALTTEAVESL